MDMTELVTVLGVLGPPAYAVTRLSRRAERRDVLHADLLADAAWRYGAFDRDGHDPGVVQARLDSGELIEREILRARLSGSSLRVETAYRDFDGMLAQALRIRVGGSSPTERIADHRAVAIFLLELKFQVHASWLRRLRVRITQRP